MQIEAIYGAPIVEGHLNMNTAPAQAFLFALAQGDARQFNVLPGNDSMVVVRSVNAALFKITADKACVVDLPGLDRDRSMQPGDVEMFASSANEVAVIREA